MIRRVGSADSSPRDAAHPRYEAESSWLFLGLLGSFFIGFLLIISSNHLFSRLIDELGQKSANERARLFIGEEITSSIQGIELELYRMVTTLGVMGQRRIQAQIEQRLDKLRGDLQVLREGGTVQRMVQLNLEGQDQMLREVSYTPPPGDERYVMELIELAPYLDQIQNKSTELMVMLAEREQFRTAQNNSGLLDSEQRIKGYLKRVPPLFVRLNENANRLFFESQNHLSDLEAQLAEQRQRYRTTEQALAVLVVVLVMLTGFMFALQINRSNRKLHRAWDAMRAAKEEAERASRAKSDFVSRMSHELRTPLNAILGLAQLFDIHGLNPAQAEHIEEINKAGQHLLELINQVLDLAKIEAGRLTLERIEFDLRALIDSVVGMVAERARVQGIALRVVVDPGLPARWRGDPTRVQQIFINLLGNALKFTERGEVGLRVEALTPGPGVRCTVHDTGIGMDAATVQRLFTPFVQADESTTRRFGGTGLGLMICKELVEAMGGVIQVESQPGQGSRFSLRLALEALDSVDGVDSVDSVSAPPLAIVAPTTPAPLLSGHVLLVEDNRVNQVVACGMLKKLGLTVTVAGNGCEALQRLEQERYDLVLMDVQMPEMDGYTATQQWRAREQHEGRLRLPVIAMTANVLNEDRERCLACGMDDYLFKPVKLSAFEQMLRRWLPAPV